MFAALDAQAAGSGGQRDGAVVPSSDMDFEASAKSQLIVLWMLGWDEYCFGNAFENVLEIFLGYDL